MRIWKSIDKVNNDDPPKDLNFDTITGPNPHEGEKNFERGSQAANRFISLLLKSE